LGKRGETAILWFRQDLRLHDLPALAAALDAAETVLPVYVLDEASPGDWAPGGASRWWLHGSLAALSGELERRGSRLLLRRGEAARVLPALANEAGAASIHASRAHEPFWRKADEAIGQALQRDGRRLELHGGATLLDLEALRTKTGTPYGMYTPFARAARAVVPHDPPLPAPRRLPAAPDLASDALEDWDLLPTRPDWAGGLRETWTPGEGGARARLQRFLRDRVGGYEAGRNRPAEPGTSSLSPHLHWGEISPRSLWCATREAGGGADADRFLAEIIWRDFSAYQLWHNPGLPEAPLRPAFRALPWRKDARGLAAWQRGRTGVPIVDAGMRQLWHTGWMHNRVRMITASFLVKHLLLDWREGERWFWDTLVDADLANNATNWQWVAGTGIDSQPFFRVFNPVSQGRKFDPEGGYVRRWVPELGAVPDRYVHAPWEAPEPPRGYPAPLLDLGQGRARALDVFRRTVRAGRPAREPAR
jgi:deoxyribodipyrimidine photo-lyase